MGKKFIKVYEETEIEGVFNTEMVDLNMEKYCDAGSDFHERIGDLYERLTIAEDFLKGSIDDLERFIAEVLPAEKFPPSFGSER